MVKNPSANAGVLRGTGLIPRSGRSPGGGNGNPLQYFCLENSMDRGSWQSCHPQGQEESDMTECLSMNLKKFMSLSAFKVIIVGHLTH